MSIEERLDLERQYHDHEGVLAHFGGRHKFTGCRQCMSQDGMRGVCRKTLAELSKTGIKLLGPWHLELGNNEELFRPCHSCNPDRNVPDSYEPLRVDDVLTWLNDDTDPMQPDYAAAGARARGGDGGRGFA